MNFVFVSPHFPHTYWQFCDRLRRNGINVLGIGDAPYDSMESPLKVALTEYYRVDSLEDYDQVYRAVAFFSWKYGKIDWIESMNEYWLEQDARLRTDFNITTGIRSDRISFIKEKRLMKQLYLEAGIPTARQHVVSDREAGKAFIDLDTLDWTEGTLLTTGKIKLYNQSDKEVNSSLLEITTENTPIDTVLIERKVLPTKTFNVRDLVTFQGHVKSGYTATIKCNPETITVAARNEVLDQLDEPVLDKRVISVQDLSETQKFEIKVSKPSDDAVLKNDTVIVTVEVEKKE